jgi:hypothetical protein
MSDNTPERRVYEGEVMPSGSESRRTLRMPPEVPFGLGFLGEAKFDAIRRVIEARERALRAIVSHLDAESEVDHALVRRAIATDKLRNVASYVRQANEEAEDLATLSKMKRELERLQLQEQINLVKERSQGRSAAPKEAEKADPFKRFVETLGRMPGVVAAARKAKEDIVAEAGGEDRLGPEHEDLMASIDQMLQEFLAGQGEGAR